MCASPPRLRPAPSPARRNIPLGQLRQRLAELPKDKEILVFCQVGRRGYLATRILTQKGFCVRNLSGGWKTFVAVTGGAPKPGAPPPPAPRETCDDSGVSCPPPASEDSRPRVNSETS